MKPLARSKLDNVVNMLALLEPIQERRERAQVERRGANIKQMIMQSHQLGENRPQILAPRRQLNPQQLLDRVMPGNLVRDRRNIIHPIYDRHVLIEVEMFAQLLEPAMQISDMRYRIDDAFAVKLKNDTQRRVRRRMLRPKIERPQILALILIGRQRIG